MGESSKTVPEVRSNSSQLMMVRREGQAELSSHHAQSLLMGPQDNAMTRYWQYYVGQTIHAHLYILEVVKSFKTGPEGKIKACSGR